jgi:DNA-binding CsgD family transcriptional regulator/tetratricopeptide (TPR) repeat protein
VGRTEELAMLDAAAASADRDGVATVLIGGDAGMGKTRLVEEWCSRASGVVVATGFCSPVGGQGRPYGPLVGILRDLRRQLANGPDAGVLLPVSQALGLASADVGDGTMSGAAASTTSALAKTRLLETILGCLTALTDRVPLVLVFEDLHWADAATAELIDFLTRNMRHGRVVILGTYRADELGAEHPLQELLAELGRLRKVTRIQLHGLERDDIETMLAAILGHDAGWALADAVYARSEGNPFFAEELAAARDAAALPEHLQDLIMLRVNRLSQGARRLLGVTATVGDRISHRLLAVVWKPEADPLDHAIAEALDRRLLAVDPPTGDYELQHALVREAVYGALRPGERIELHCRVAVCIEAHPDLAPAGTGQASAELASHWWAAGEWADALTASCAAASAAESVFAFVEAHAHLERVLDAWARVQDAPARTGTDRAGLLIRASDAAFCAGSRQRATELAQAACDAVDATAEPRRAALYLARLGRSVTTVSSQAALDALGRAAALLSEDGPSVERARVGAEHARWLMVMSRSHDAQALCHDAIATARAAGARAEEGHATNTLGCCLTDTGRPDDGIALIKQALEIAEELRSPDDLNRAYTNLSDALFKAGRLEESAAVSLDAAAAGQELDGIRLEGAALNSAEALFRLGRWPEAKALLAERGPARSVCVDQSDLLRAFMAVREGKVEEARQALAAADDNTAKLTDVQSRGWYHMLRAELALEEHRPGDAADDVDLALSLAAASDDEFYGPEMCALGVRAVADAHDQTRFGRGGAGAHTEEKARMLAAGLAEEAERLVAAPAIRGAAPLPQPSAFALLCRAEESRLYQSDPELWGAAASTWDERRQPYPAAYCRFHQAAALLSPSGARRAAADVLRQAWRASQVLGAAPLRARIERLADRARIDLAAEAVPAAGGYSVAADLGLTVREVDVLGQLAACRTDAQIAEQLFISKKTASVHVSNVLRKLGVANRFDAGQIGRDAGLGQDG